MAIGNLPNSPKAAAFVAYLWKPKTYFKNLMFNFLHGRSKEVLNRLKESFCILTVVVLIVPHISLPYNNTGLAV